MNFIHWNTNPEIFSSFYIPQTWVFIVIVVLYCLLYFMFSKKDSKTRKISEYIFWLSLVGILIISWFVDKDLLFRKIPTSPRWYGLCFASGLLLGYFLVDRMARFEGKDQLILSKLFIYVVLGTVIGSRLGHCLFYEPDYYLSNPIEILCIWKGGLASHGGTLGVCICVFLFSLFNKKLSLSWILDRCAMGSALAAGFIRLGNFFNSEILGVSTQVPWAIVFDRVDSIPRHPAQLYEAISYFLIFFILLGIYIFKKAKFKKGLMFGLLFVFIFGTRFFIEFVKIEQVDFERGMLLNMGQLLSIPFVLVGLFFTFGGYSYLLSKWKWLSKLEHDEVENGTEYSNTTVVSSSKSKISKKQGKNKKGRKK